MIRVVLDTNILFSAVFKSTGTQANLIRLIVDKQIIPCVSPATLAEYHEVLARPILHHRAAEVEHILNLLTGIALLVVPTTSATAAIDPDDNAFSNAPKLPPRIISSPGTSGTFQRAGRERKL
jgi:putative PIN family toxin of toxin-antitoxin system